jgi:hypothetical protein
MEIKRTPYRVLTWHKSDCADVQDAVGHVMKLLDKDLNNATAKRDEVEINRLVKYRSTLHTLLVASVEI